MAIKRVVEVDEHGRTDAGEFLADSPAQALGNAGICPSCSGKLALCIGGGGDYLFYSVIYPR